MPKIAYCTSAHAVRQVTSELASNVEKGLIGTLLVTACIASGLATASAQSAGVMPATTVTNQTLITFPTGNHAFLIANLRPTSASDYDHLHLLVTLGGWGNTDQSSFDLMFGNRNGFNCLYTLRGEAPSANAKLAAYVNTSDNSTDIWLVFTSMFGTASYTVLENEEDQVFTNPTDTGTVTSSGALLFDSSDPHWPPVTHVDFPGNFTIDNNANVRGNFVYLGPGEGALFSDYTNTVIQAAPSGFVYVAPVGKDGTRIAASDGSVRIGGPDQPNAKLYFADGSSVSSVGGTINLNNGSTLNYENYPIIQIVGPAGGESQFFGLFIGTSSLTGINNFMFGERGGSSFTTGSYNTGFGDYNFQATTTGSNNAAFGPQALQSLIDGSANVAIGNAAGAADGHPAMVHGSSNTFIGASTSPMNDSDSNETVIGSNAVGLGDNTTVIGSVGTYKTALMGNVGIGTTNPGAKLDVNGSMRLSGTGAVITFPDNSVQHTAWNGTASGQDYAESVNIVGERTEYEPGDVMMIDPMATRHFTKSDKPYSRFVAGIYSTKPGILGKRAAGTSLDGDVEISMAVMGIVPTKVSAENGSIEPGDLLVSASIAGYAMKGTEGSRMLGAVVGKALASFKTGKGLIEVLISLQ